MKFDSKAVRGRWIAAVALAAGLALAAVGVTRGASSGSVRDVQLQGGLASARITVELSRRPGAASATANPGAVVVTFAKADLPRPLHGVGDGLVRSWRVTGEPGAARLNIETAHDATVYRRFLLPPSDGVSAYRYVIDLKRADGVIDIRPAAPGPPPLKIVIIDPGHGGSDPGAIGPRGPEKDITLAAALELQRQLEAGGRYRVVITRTGDDFVSVGTRARIAAQVRPDLFISLHANAHTDASLRGAAVYTLSDRGQAQAASIAMRQEAATSDDPTLRRILVDLKQTTTKTRSSALADAVLAHLPEGAPLLGSAHRRAELGVLLAPEVPAVLLEMGFISNPDDEAALHSARQRARLMGGVANAIDTYMSGVAGAAG